MFLIAQFIGLAIINYYAQPEHPLPYGMGMPEKQEYNTPLDILSIVVAFAIAISVFFLLSKHKSKVIIRLWFFVVVLLALGVFFTALLNLQKPFLFLGLVFALPIALSKIYKRNIVIHNLSELMIYPAIAAIFVPYLNVLGAIILLGLISIYDAWAVWKSGIMQKMAKFQMTEVKVFGGFLIPYLTKQQRTQLKKLENSNKKLDKKIKVNVAVLGGGDVVFPTIVAGIALINLGLFAALSIILGAFMGLGLLLILSEKKKFYPAMPFISAGILICLGLWALVF
jgi:presenilin-like A22 family membrane protease